MDELISRQAAINMKGLLEDWTGKEYEAVLVKDIEQLPSAEPPRIRGQWSIKGQAIDTIRGYWATCSACGHAVFGGGNYCSYCGSYNKGEVII